MVKTEELRVGSIVRLASGSPKMGVTGVTDGKMVKVVWWSDRLGVLTDEFEAELLVFPRTREMSPGAVDADAEGDEA